MRFAIFLLFLLGWSFAYSQSVGVTSYYPASAYVTKRLLPFTVEGSDDSKIKAVVILKGDSCFSFVDPFYSHIFHLYCESPDQLLAEVRFDDSQRGSLSFQVGEFTINENNAPGSTEVRAFDNSGEN